MDVLRFVVYLLIGACQLRPSSYDFNVTIAQPVAELFFPHPQLGLLLAKLGDRARSHDIRDGLYIPVTFSQMTRRLETQPLLHDIGACTRQLLVKLGDLLVNHIGVWPCVADPALCLQFLDLGFGIGKACTQLRRPVRQPTRSPFQGSATRLELLGEEVLRDDVGYALGRRRIRRRDRKSTKHRTSPRGRP